MESQDRIAAVVKLGFTERQARFLVLVMQYSGVCLLRQYSAFAGIVHGQKTRKFFAKLVSRRFATAYCCRHNRGRVYTILLPASAVPGWPADVVLPSDPVWKRDYSGSVRRLIRDGVDTPLASLFVHAARSMPEDAEGAARARSATEAFLYRRLDTLNETNGRFRLNVALPIPFDGFGTLEVDLLCADARLAIELDGGQHLADPIAYRRDRRKDQLLQENGYFVLRFLAEDVGKDLDAVLDAILRVLARHRQSAARSEPLKFVRRGGE